MNGVLLVTGGSRGIGAAICTLAARRGLKVAVNYNRSTDRAMSVVNAIRQQGGEAVAINGDVTREADVVRMFTEVDEKLGRITSSSQQRRWWHQPRADRRGYGRAPKSRSKHFLSRWNRL